MNTLPTVWLYSVCRCSFLMILCSSLVNMQLIQGSAKSPSRLRHHADSTSVGAARHRGVSSVDP